METTKPVTTKRIITASDPNGSGRSVSIEFTVGQTLADTALLFGPQYVHEKFLDGLVIAIQGVMRTAIKKGKPDSEVMAKGLGYVPRVIVREPKAPPTAASALELFAQLSPEEQAKFLAAAATK